MSGATCGNIGPDIASLIRATAMQLPVARMSGATCGEHWPGYRFAHPGYGDTGGAVLTCRAYLSSMIMRASAMRSTSTAPSVIIMLR